jgi:hypothetical protein
LKQTAWASRESYSECKPATSRDREQYLERPMSEARKCFLSSPFLWQNLRLMRRFFEFYLSAAFARTSTSSASAKYQVSIHLNNVKVKVKTTNLKLLYVINHIIFYNG